VTSREVDVLTAARLLDVTPDAVRARLRRGTLPGERRGGRWVVFLSDDTDTTRNDTPKEKRDTDTTEHDETRHETRHRHDTDTTERDGDRGELDALRSEVTFLRERLEAAEAEKRALLVNVERLTRALPPPKDDDQAERERDREPSEGVSGWFRRWLRG